MALKWLSSLWTAEKVPHSPTIVEWDVTLNLRLALLRTIGLCGRTVPAACGRKFFHRQQVMERSRPRRCPPPSPPHPTLHPSEPLWKLWSQIWTQRSVKASGQLCCLKTALKNQPASKSPTGQTCWYWSLLRIYFFSSFSVFQWWGKEHK